jgi:hypothetical protein
MFKIIILLSTHYRVTEDVIQQRLVFVDQPQLL